MVRGRLVKGEGRYYGTITRSGDRYRCFILLLAGGADAAAPKRLKVSEEIIDTWYFITEIIYVLDTANHRCAICCAVGGIPVSLKGNGGNSYMVLKMEGDATSVANPAI